MTSVCLVVWKALYIYCRDVWVAMFDDYCLFCYFLFFIAAPSYCCILSALASIIMKTRILTICLIALFVPLTP